MYFRKLVGKKCYLSPMDPDDAPKYAEWLNDYEISQYLTSSSAVLNIETERELISSLAKQHNYSIVDSRSDELVGNCGLMDIDAVNRTAEIGIFIGNKSYQNKGYGSEALGLLIDYAFSVLNLTNIMLKVYSFNERALNCYRRIGFKTIGSRRNALVKDRKQYDIVFMDILADDYYQDKSSDSNQRSF